ncbi:uncharacterized protein LOC118817680 isoform X2 [Colossoma macropomum]|nr:uncharacterized protein LOC118817680 isoform X2 [Colossoma macropomum]
MVFGNTMNSHLTFMNLLSEEVKIQDVHPGTKSNAIVAFVSIVSRAGTDITAALTCIPVNRPVVLVVLHHTFDPHFVAPESRHCVTQKNVFTVDCLYHEDRGLLRCQRNDQALKAVKEHLISKGASPVRFEQVTAGNWELMFWILALIHIALIFVGCLSLWYLLVVVFFVVLKKKSGYGERILWLFLLFSVLVFLVLIIQYFTASDTSDNF